MSDCVHIIPPQHVQHCHCLRIQAFILGYYINYGFAIVIIVGIWFAAKVRNGILKL